MANNDDEAVRRRNERGRQALLSGLLLLGLIGFVLLVGSALLGYATANPSGTAGVWTTLGATAGFAITLGGALLFCINGLIALLQRARSTK